MSDTAASTLTLEVSGPQAESLGAERRKTFGLEGGTIGRAPGNRWVLADAYVSNRHASIALVDGVFCIEDLESKNGVFINDCRLEPGRPSPIQSGDRLFIEPYDIVASVEYRGAASGSPRADQGFRGSVWGVVGPEIVPPVEPASGGDWLDEIAPPLPDAPRPVSVVAPVLGNDPLRQHIRPPVVASPSPVGSGPVIPEGYDPLAPARGGDLLDPPGRRDPPSALATTPDPPQRRGPMTAAPPPAAAPFPPADSPRGGDAAGGVLSGTDLGDVLAGAGLEGIPVTPAVARQFGQILRVVVAGVLDVLQARQEVKGEFRIRPTVIQRRRNNPLKHSVDVEDALHNLLVKRNPAYLGPVEAFEDAFNDVRNHQLAMLAGVRVAFEAMFAQFDPDHLQKEFDRHTPRAKRGALAALQGKPDYWDFYRDWMQRLSQDADGSFRTLFGDEFAKAYEEQLDRLKTDASGHGRRPRTGAEE